MTRDEQIAALYQQGKSQREIGRTIGMSQVGVRKNLLKLGLLITRVAASRAGKSDNLDQKRRAEPSDGSPGPLDNRADTVHSSPAAPQNGGGGDSRLLPSTPHGPARQAPVCIICHSAFVPQFYGQRCCCNGCGNVLAKYWATITHTEECRLLHAA